MSLHARSIALHVGAVGEQVDLIAAEMSALGDVRPERAIAILERLRGNPTPLVRGN
jgi:hydroxymethylglutaryl-CoA reductase